MTTLRAVDNPRPTDVAHRTGKLVFAAVVAFSAYAGALGLATGTLDLGSLDQRLPLHSPVLGGLALTVTVGVPTTIVAWLVARSDERAGHAAILAGALLIGWIVVEIAFIREFSFLQPFYVGVGAVFIVIGRHGSARPRAVRPRAARLLRPLGRDLRATLDEDVVASGLGTPQAMGPAVTDDDIAHLPEAAQRYLRFMGVIGRPRDSWFRAHLRGRFRMRPGQRFMPCECWQYNSGRQTARLFHMRIDFAGILPMVGRDSYVRGHGRMLGKLVGLVTVANGEGPETDMSELTTYLNDAVMMAPSMLLTPAVTWSPVDDDAFDVSLTDGGVTVTARVFLDGHGAPRDFRTTDRYAALPTGLVRAEWTTPMTGWTSDHGRRMPTKGSAIWHLPDGPFVYAEFTFGTDSIEYPLSPSG